MDISRERLCSNSFTIGATHSKVIQISKEIILHYKLEKNKVSFIFGMKNVSYLLGALANQESTEYHLFFNCHLLVDLKFVRVAVHTQNREHNET